MFFVNSRPCTLPQVAKAFNEVYKSYNITQSPFIFADIKLDTNAYDVNVSPDKRTILLHDQTTLLESLKEALIELFEGHDQSVPHAQLQGKRTPSLPFKPPVFQHRESASSAVEDRTEPDDMFETRKTSSTSVQDVNSSMPSGELPRPGFIKASLIERFAGRDTRERAITPPRRRRSISPESDKVTEERVFHPNPRRRSDSPEEAPMPRLSTRRSASPLFEPEREPSPTREGAEETPQAVHDFNARIASQHAKQMERERSSRSPRSGEGEQEEENIPAIKQTPQKRLSQSTIQNAFDRMRPMRTPAQQATITIGDTTTVSTVGSASQSRASKRARIHTPKLGLNGTPLSQTPKRPLFMKSLRGFAAPGTQLEGSDDEEEEDSEDAPDSSMPDAPARPPSPHKQLPTTTFEEPTTDDLEESSSAPVLPPIEEDVVEIEEPDPIAPADDGSDDEYIDESEKKAREEAKIAMMIAEAEEAAARPTEMNLKRANKLFNVSQKKYSTLNLERVIDTDAAAIQQHLERLTATLQDAEQKELQDVALTSTQLNKEDPEERLSLSVTKSDFNNMRIIGQFNLGFILAVRPPTSTSPTCDLFIIDQHASDEKYNFERFSATTVLVSQRLVHPHPLELTAVEEEIILANENSLTANGFVVEMDTSGDTDVRRRAKLTSLPMSKEVTFTPHDLEELLALVLDNPPSSSTSISPHIPRPSKVRKLLASRACRSSVMIGKTLKNTQMETIVKHMGSMDKPWSCPHGRPTMRHLFGLEQWEGWKEGDGVTGLEEVGLSTDWGVYLKSQKRRARM